MIYKLTIILLLFPLQLFSQRFERVDSYVDSISLDNSLTPEELTIRITNPFTDDIDKVRAIYYWIAKNIKYDYAGFSTDFWTHYSSNESLILDTYNFRKGVCAGYSHLFKNMLSYCEIESEVINGYARVNLETFFLNESNHAWNAVKLNNDWYLFDVTWATDTITNEVSDFYFQTQPDLFILNHYPLDYAWALLDKHYSLDEYNKFPVYSNLFHEINFTNDISKNGFIKAVDDTIMIKIKPNYDCTLLTKILNLDNGEWISTQMGDFVRGDDYFKLYIPMKGKFILRIGAVMQNDITWTFYNRLIYYLIVNE